MSEAKVPYSVPPMGGSAITQPSSLTEQSIQEATRILTAAHRHNYTYLLNAQMLIRGCTGCGITDVTQVGPSLCLSSRWFRVREQEKEDTHE